MDGFKALFTSIADLLRQAGVNLAKLPRGARLALTGVAIVCQIAETSLAQPAWAHTVESVALLALAAIGIVPPHIPPLRATKK